MILILPNNNPSLRRLLNLHLLLLSLILLPTEQPLQLFLDNYINPISYLNTQPLTPPSQTS